MGLIDNFEKRLERFVNGAFSKAFKSQIQPVEISAAIKAKMDKAAAIVAKDRILAPNAFTVRLSQNDYSRLNQMGAALSAEITKQVLSHAKKQRYQFAGELKISIETSPALTVGQIQISSQGSKAPDLAQVDWIPYLEINGELQNIGIGRTTVGRDASADIQVADNGLSRTHFAITWDGSSAKIEDLGSTNGTKIAGVKIKSQALPADTVISAGRTDFVFRVKARAGGQE